MTKKRTLGIIALILLFGFLTRIAYFFHTMQDIDEGSHAAVATALLNGGTLYLNAVDNKPPGVFYIYYATFLVFGKYNMTAIHMVTFLWTLATALILSILARKMGGTGAALFTLLFYLTFTAALYAKMIAANTEIFMVLPYSMAVLLFWHACSGQNRYFYFLAGFVSGLAPLFKQVGGIAVTAVFLYLLVAIPLLRGRKRILPGIAAFANFAIGFALPLALVFLLFYKYRMLKAWYFWDVTYPSRYISLGSVTLNFPSQLAIEFGLFFLSTLVLWILASFWIKTLFTDLRRRDVSPGSGFPLFLILWLAVSMAATMLGKRMYGHYFIQILPPLTLIAGLYAAGFFAEQRASHRKGWRVAILALTIVPGLVFTGLGYSYEATTDTWGEIRPDFRVASEYIKTHTLPQDRIFVWGYFTPIYVYSQRAPSTRFASTTIHTGYKAGNDRDENDRADLAWLTIPEAWSMLEADLNRDPPAVIVDTSPGNYHDFGRYPIRNYPILEGFVEKNCRLEKSIAGMDIYRCRDGK
ncbi:MAG TPA: glycosyltransferase family 39 protein [Acidobacteriota bacterium]|nr:glycosyltransferase family 39 protein [Acidobacteriota bacterium]